MNARLSLTLISCAVLAACASTKPVQLPKLDVPTTWLATIATTESSGNAPWDTLLNQPDLAALIKLSDDSNPSLRAAAARVAAAQAIYGIQNSARFPVVGAELGASRGKQPVGGSSNQIVESANLTAPMSWEIDLWGRIADTSAAAKQDYLSSEEVYRAARVSLNSQVAQTWLRLLNLDDQLTIADSTVTAQTASLDLVVKRFKGGEASMVDVSQAKATLGLVNASRADIDRSRQRAASRRGSAATGASGADRARLFRIAGRRDAPAAAAFFARCRGDAFGPVRGSTIGACSRYQSRDAGRQYPAGTRHVPAAFFASFISDGPDGGGKPSRGRPSPDIASHQRPRARPDRRSTGRSPFFRSGFGRSAPPRRHRAGSRTANANPGAG